jgi:hypothetical protein
MPFQFKRYAPDFISAGLGVAVFLVVYGPQFLLNRTPYLTYPVGDIASEMAGYFSFAHDTWRFPLFLMPTINQPEGSNLLFTGGVPLLALLAKVIHSLSGRVPNLFGPWYLLCCILQTHSFFFLMRQFTERRPMLLAAASICGGVAYAFLMRTGHVSLFAQFLCIYAMGLVVASTRDRYLPGQILAGIALLVYISMFVFAYIAIMNTFLFVAALASLWHRERLTTRQAFKSFTVFFVIQIVISFIGGYFWGVGQAEPVPLSSFALFGLNLGALFNPPQSILFPSHPLAWPWWEGTFYLGIGVIGLWIAILIRAPQKIYLAVKTHWPIAAVLAVLIVYSLSNRVAFLDTTLISYPLPRFLGPVIGMARTSGRLFWPVGYLLMAASFALVVIEFRRAAPVMVSAALFLVCIEATGPITYVRSLVNTPGPAPLDYPTLFKIMSEHHSVFAFPSFWCGVGSDHQLGNAYEEIEYSSSRFGLGSNFAITARKIKDCNEEAVGSHFMKPGEVNFFMSRAVAMAAVDSHPSDVPAHCRQFTVGTGLGFACSAAWTAETDLTGFSAVTDLVVPLTIGETIDFSSSGNSKSFISAGWWVTPHDEFTLTNEREAIVRFKLPPSPSEDLQLKVTAMPFLVPNVIPERVVSVFINDEKLGDWSFTGESWAPSIRSVVLPHGLDGRSVRLVLKQSEIRSPKELGINNDFRRMGLALKSIQLLSVKDN